MKRAAVWVEKGGVGKTTTACHLAAAAHHEFGHETVLLDLTGQNDVAQHFGVFNELDSVDAPIAAVFSDEWSVIRDNLSDTELRDRMILPTDIGVDVIPSDGLGAADTKLASVPTEDRYTRLDAFLDDILAEVYDLAVIDLPGSENNITLNGLFAAPDVITPLRPGFFEEEQLQSLVADLDRLSETHDVSLQLALTMATMVDSRIDQHSQFVDALSEEWPEIAGPPITTAQDIPTLQGLGGTLFDPPDDYSLYQTGKRAREAYRENTELLFDRL